MPATYEPIATQTVSVAAARITFSSIPATYTDLRLVLNNIHSTTSGGMTISFNGVPSGTSHSWTYIEGNGTNANSGRGRNEPSITVSRVNTVASGNTFLYTFDIFSYAGSTNKTCLITSSQDRNGSGVVSNFVGLWRNTAAITSIVLETQTFAVGSTATLYGIKNA
jgi:hypothetical protein